MLGRLRGPRAVARAGADGRPQDAARSPGHAPPRCDRRLARAPGARATPKSPLGQAIGYVRKRWAALTRYLDDGRLKIDNSEVERLIRLVALGRKNYLFAGSDAGAERAAIAYTVLGTCALHWIDPWAYLRERAREDRRRLAPAGDRPPAARRLGRRAPRGPWPRAACLTAPRPSPPAHHGRLTPARMRMVGRLLHKERNLLARVPRHAREAVQADYRAIVEAESEPAARAAWRRFVRKWEKTLRAVVRSLEEGGEELLTFFRYPKSQWKCLRMTSAIERLLKEFRGRVKVRENLPDGDSAVALLHALWAEGCIAMRRLDGYRELASVIARRGMSHKPQRRAA